MSTVTVQGNQFNINGKQRPYLGRTSFCLLGHYQEGNRSKAREWMARCKELGFDLLRVFGENQIWFGNNSPFYGTKWTPRIDAVDHYNISSRSKLRPGYYDLFSKFLSDLGDYGLLAEMCCMATLKSELDEGEVGHVLNRFAQMGREIVGDPGKSPIIWECVNEWNAYSDISPSEASRMCGRFRRSNPGNPSHHNYPGALISTSAGGSWHMGGRPVLRGETHYNSHLPRKHNEFPSNSELRYHKSYYGGKPLANNETIHCMTQVQYNYWVTSGRIRKWHNLSCTNVPGFIDYIGRQHALGISVCFHDLIGQETNPDYPFSPAEVSFAERFGEPVEPPEPVNPIEYKMSRAIHLAYADFLDREPDEGGIANYLSRMFNGMSEAEMREAIMRDPGEP